MKNKVFSVWLRELCSLIFVQSMQALLFVVMMSVVVKLYIQSINEENLGARQAMGIYAVFVLYCVPKVELLVKQIFGLGSGVMKDGMNAGKDFLRTGFAIAAGKRILNNAGKFAAGAVGLGATAITGHMRASRVAKKNLEGSGNGNNGARRILGRRANSGSGTNGNSGTGLALGTGGSSSNNSSGGNVSDLTAAIKAANAKDPQEELARIKHETRQKQIKNLQNLTSGVTETLGAATGATLGAIYGLGTGDNVLSNAAIGMGAGDAVGEGLASGAFGAIAGTENFLYDITDHSGKKKNKSAEMQQMENDADARLNAIREQAGNRNTNNTNTNSSVNTRPVKTSADLSAIEKGYYDKAIEAKNKGDMAAYYQNRGIAAGLKNANKTGNTDSKQYYEKAKEAKRRGDMNAYNTNKGIAAGINKANKISASNSTSNNSSTRATRTSPSQNRTTSYSRQDMDAAVKKAIKNQKRTQQGFKGTSSPTGGTNRNSSIDNI